MRPDAGSIAIAGRTGVSPARDTRGWAPGRAVTELAAKTALCVAPAAAQSCHATRMRPLASASADGSGMRGSPRCHRARDVSDANGSAPRRAAVSRRRRCDGEPTELPQVRDHQFARRSDHREYSHRRPCADVDPARPGQSTVVRPPHREHVAVRECV
jgi:hypothetical protein